MISVAVAHKPASQALRSVEFRSHRYRMVCSCGSWETGWDSWTRVTAQFDEHLQTIDSAPETGRPDC